MRTLVKAALAARLSGNYTPISVSQKDLKLAQELETLLILLQLTP